MSNVQPGMSNVQVGTAPDIPALKSMARYQYLARALTWTLDIPGWTLDIPAWIFPVGHWTLKKNPPPQLLRKRTSQKPITSLYRRHCAVINSSYSAPLEHVIVLHF
jgi:hypothetical protein